VQEDYENAKKLYGNYPTRQARLLGMEEGLKKHEEAITALQSIIEQPSPVQEPVAPKPWVGLTDEELTEAEIEGGKSYKRWVYRIGGQMIMPQDSLQWHFSRAIEDKLRNKNT
jgi:hypothetical protein